MVATARDMATTTTDTSGTQFLIEHPDTFFKNNHTSNMTDIAPTILSFIGIQSAEFSCKKDGISLIKQYSTTNN